LDAFAEWIVPICVAIGLSAAAGFRVFLPLLFLAIAAHQGVLELGPDFAWLGQPKVIVALAAASAIEAAAYYVPWLDNALDTVTTPLALLAGALVTFTTLAHFDPFLKWSLALIAGAGTAGLVQLSTVAARSASTGLTGGLGNFVIATVETLSAGALAALALLLPVVAVALVALLFVAGYRFVRFAWRRLAGGARAPAP